MKFDITKKELDAWREVRAKGRRSFILKRGVLFWGLFMAVSMAIFQVLIDDAPFQWGALLRQLGINLIIYPIGGYAWGAWMWWYMDRRYRRSGGTSSTSV